MAIQLIQPDSCVPPVSSRPGIWKEVCHSPLFRHGATRLFPVSLHIRLLVDPTELKPVSGKETMFHL